jgi:hypothetical protein
LSAGVVVVGFDAMLRAYLVVLLLGIGLPLPAAERVFDFSRTPPGEAPPGFRSAVTGDGRPGDWRVIREELKSSLAPANAARVVTTQESVLAQLAQDPTDEHFPLLIYEGETYGDFTLTTRVKMVSGHAEQMAGLAFRIQDETNYYVLRASSLGNSFRFYKFVDGERSPPVGVDVEVPSGIWHELGVECKGNRIRCRLNGRQLFPDLTDNSFAEGRVGFWTKSDSVAWFADTRLVHAPREILARQLVREMMKEYPRLLGLQLYASTGARKELHVVASHREQELATAGGRVEQAVLETGIPHWGTEKGRTSVVLPLRDRNGDPAAVVRFIMESRVGQTEQNALARVTPIVRQMEKRVRTAKDLTQ